MRKIELLKEWTFELNGDSPEKVTVPHDWAIYGPFDPKNDFQIIKIVQNGDVEAKKQTGRTGGLPIAGHGKYTCEMDGPSAPDHQVYLEFDGVMSHAKVFVNGSPAGSCNYGYTSFIVPVTQFLKPGKNKVEVTADPTENASRWYPGAGMYRPARRVETPAVHLLKRDLFLRYSAEERSLLISGRVACFKGTSGSVEILLESEAFSSVRLQLASGTEEFSAKIPLNDIREWSVDDPVLYDVKCTLFCGGETDELTVRYGFRRILFDKDHGFLLNGKKVKINGVCMHHDLGPLGAAFNRAAAARQLRLLKSMGCNAIRTSHNPPAPGLLDLCDEMGFVVMDEAFDGWRAPKTPKDYNLHFDAEAEKDLSTLVRRDRNHPCVILWSIGNEVMEIRDKKLGGAEIAKQLTAIVKKHDTTRPVTAGLDACEMAIDSGIAAQLDLPAWNYRPQSYAQYHKIFPEVPVLGSETLSTYSSRGKYYFPAYEYVYDRYPARKEAHEHQCSSYCLDIPTWSHTPEAEQLAQDSYDFAAGQFIWTGFDYLGEPCPFNLTWPARSSYFGCFDLAGLPKDLAFLMKSFWKKDAEPMVHIVPQNWNWKEGQSLDVHVFSNCEEVELFINGKSLGRIKPFFGSAVLAERYRFIWHSVAWEKGEVRAAGYRNGVLCTEEVLRTAGNPAKIVLSTDKTECTADGEDMLFVTAKVQDAAGNLCPDAVNLVRFRMDGNSLRIAAADAGDPTSLKAFHVPECRMFAGKCVVYLRSTGEAGKSVLHAESEGLVSAEIPLNAQT